MAGKTLDIKQMIQRQGAAEVISNQFQEWQTFRKNWLEEKKELRNYLFATDTTKTTNNKLPWKNSTTIPKLTQIRDNLHSNYMAALFPNDDWLEWVGNDKDSVEKAKKDIIQAYMLNKIKFSQFEETVERLLYDFIDYGNVFGTTEYVAEFTEDAEGNRLPGYVGPKLIRLSPYDTVFNPVAISFDQSPKIVRTLKSLGELKRDIEEKPELAYEAEIFNVIAENRRQIGSLSDSDVAKGNAYTIDGFSDIKHYYQSGYVEILEFYGDFYDITEDKLYKNHIITVVDRSHVIRRVPNPSWSGRSRIKHAGWRLRPDNLYAMGPLDNLVGMQYRIDHLENLKADVFDLIAHPVMKIKGVVEDFTYGPGAKIFVGDDGEVEFIRPDATALNADTQIQILEAKMEEMAGAPKQAMGIRTPGEKTKYEVQTLENAAGRIFQNKIAYFEKYFLEPLLNDMLELSRRNMEDFDVIRVLDDELGAAIFKEVSREDLAAAGVIKPIGARHFAKKANMLQNLTSFSNSTLGTDPAVKVHFSGYEIAKVVEDLLDIDKYNIVSKNILMAEQMETQQAMNAGNEILQEEGMEQAQPTLEGGNV